MTVIKSETREGYHINQSHVVSLRSRWKLTPAPPPRQVHPDAVDIIFIDYNSGAIDLAAAAQRVRELISAAKVASANDALVSWVDDEPTGLFGDDDDYRCPFCRARDGQCSH